MAQLFYTIMDGMITNFGNVFQQTLLFNFPAFFYVYLNFYLNVYYIYGDRLGRNITRPDITITQ